MMCAAALLVGPIIRNTCSREEHLPTQGGNEPVHLCKAPIGHTLALDPYTAPCHSCREGGGGGSGVMAGGRGRGGRRVSWHNEPPTLAPT
jgi:hypothetical protein